jgi:hypothetical protein
MGKNYQQVNPEMSSLLDEALYGDDSSEVARIVWWIHQELLVTYEDYLALQAWFLHLVFAFDRVALSELERFASRRTILRFNAGPK